MNNEMINDTGRGEICYFCKADLKNLDRKEKKELRCCKVVTHKKELFQWFLKHQYCPNCLAEDKKIRQQILDWGLKNDIKKKKTKKSIEYMKWKEQRYAKKLRETKKKRNN